MLGGELRVNNSLYVCYSSSRETKIIEQAVKPKRKRIPYHTKAQMEVLNKRMEDYYTEKQFKEARMEVFNIDHGRTRRNDEAGTGRIFSDF